MTEPIVFISHHKVKEGRLEAFKQFSRDRFPEINAGKPHTVAFLAFLNARESEVSFLHVFPDAEAMDLHFMGAAERAKATYESLEPLGFEICGRPNEAVLDGMRGEGRGLSLNLSPHFMDGYLRLRSGAAPGDS